MSDVAEAFEDVAALVELATASLGIPAPIGVAVKLTALVLRGADDVVRVIEGDELEELRRLKAVGEAAGQAAYEASRQDFRKSK